MTANKFPEMLGLYFFFFFFFNVYLFERERDRVQAGEVAEREGDTESEAGSRL